MNIGIPQEVLRMYIRTTTHSIKAPPTNLGRALLNRETIMENPISIVTTFIGKVVEFSRLGLEKSYIVVQNLQIIEYILFI